MKAFLVKTLGPNWHVKVFGWLTAAFGYVALNPSSIAFLPDGVEGYVMGFVKLLTGIGAVTTVGVLKGSNVTGGSVPATKEAVERMGGEGATEIHIPETDNVPQGTDDPIMEDEYDNTPRKPLIILK